MHASLLTIVKYNLKFIHKKLMLLLGWTIALLFFHTLYYVGYAEQISASEIYLLSIGGTNVEQLHLIQMFIVLLPYLGIAVIVDVYITQMMGKHAIYTITRMKRRALFIKSHLVTLFFILFFLLFIYHCSLITISFSIYNGSQISEPLFPWLSVYENKFQLILFIFSGQLLGTFCTTCVQLIVSTKLNRYGSSFIVIAILYFLQLVVPFNLGQHIFISNIVTDYATFLRFVLIQLIIISGSIMYLYVISKRNITVFSERS